MVVQLFNTDKIGVYEKPSKVHIDKSIAEECERIDVIQKFINLLPYIRKDVKTYVTQSADKAKSDIEKNLQLYNVENKKGLTFVSSYEPIAYAKSQTDKLFKLIKTYISNDVDGAICQKDTIYATPIAITNQLTQLIAEVKRKTDDYNNLLAQHATVQAQLQQAQADIQTKDAEIIRLRQDVANRDLQITRLQNTLATRNQQIGRLRARLRTYYTLLTTERGNNAALQGQLATEQATNAALQGQLATEQATNAALQGQLATESGNNAALQATNAALQGQLLTEQKNVAAKQADLDAKQDELKAKQAELDAKQAELDAKQAELNRDNAANSAHITQLQNDIQAKTRKLARKQTEMDTLSQQLSDKQKELDQAASDNKANDAEITRLEDELNAKQRELQTIQGKLQAKQRELNQTKDELATKQRELDQTKAALDAKQGELDRADIALRAKQDELDRAAALVAQLRQDLHDCKTASAEYEQELAECAGKIKRLRKELNDASTRLQQAIQSAQQAQQAEQKAQQAQQAMQAAQQQARQAEQQAQQAMQAAQQRAQHAEQQAQQAQQAVHQAQQQVQDIQLAYTNDPTIPNLRREIADKEVQISQQQEEYKRLNLSLDGLKQEIKDKQQKLVDADTLVGQLRDQLRMASNGNRQLADSNTHLRQQSANLHQQLHEVQTSIGEAKRENEELRALIEQKNRNHIVELSNLRIEISQLQQRNTALYNQLHSNKNEYMRSIKDAHQAYKQDLQRLIDENEAKQNHLTKIQGCIVALYKKHNEFMVNLYRQAIAKLSTGYSLDALRNHYTNAFNALGNILMNNVRVVHEAISRGIKCSALIEQLAEAMTRTITQFDSDTSAIVRSVHNLQITRELTELKQAHDQLASELTAERQARLNDNTTNARTLSEQKRQLETQAAQISSLQQQHAAQIQNLNDRHTREIQHITDEKDDIITRMRDELARMQAQLEAQSRELEAKSRELDTQRQQLEEQSRALQAATNAYRSSESQILGHTNRVFSTTQETNRVRDALNACQAQLVQKTEQLEECQAQIHRIQSAHDENIRRIRADYDAKLSELSNREQAINAHHASAIDQKNAELKSRINALTERNSQLEKVNTELTAVNSRLTNVNSRLTADNAELKAANVRLTEELKSRTQQYNEANNQISIRNLQYEESIRQLEAELANVSKQLRLCQEAKNASSDCTAEMETHNHSLADIRAKHDALQAENRTLNARIAELATALYENQNSVTTNTNVELTASHNALLNEKQREIVKLQSEIQRLTNELQAASRAISDREQRLAEQQQQIAAQQQQIDKLKHDLSQIYNTLDVNHGDIDNMLQKALDRINVIKQIEEIQITLQSINSKFANIVSDKSEDMRRNLSSVVNIYVNLRDRINTVYDKLTQESKGEPFGSAFSVALRNLTNVSEQIDILIDLIQSLYKILDSTDLISKINNLSSEEARGVFQQLSGKIEQILIDLQDSIDGFNDVRSSSKACRLSLPDEILNKMKGQISTMLNRSADELLARGDLETDIRSFKTNTLSELENKINASFDSIRGNSDLQSYNTFILQLFLDINAFLNKKDALSREHDQILNAKIIEQENKIKHLNEILREFQRIVGGDITNFADLSNSELSRYQENLQSIIQNASNYHDLQSKIMAEFKFIQEGQHNNVADVYIKMLAFIDQYKYSYNQMMSDLQSLIASVPAREQNIIKSRLGEFQRLFQMTDNFVETRHTGDHIEQNSVRGGGEILGDYWRGFNSKFMTILVIVAVILLITYLLYLLYLYKFENYLDTDITYNKARINRLQKR